MLVHILLVSILRAHFLPLLSFNSNGQQLQLTDIKNQ